MESNFKKLNNQELSSVVGGSNDGFWTGVGYYSRILYNTQNHNAKMFGWIL